MLQGKGMFIWRIQHCEDGDPERIVAAAQAAGLQHVCVKVADGAESFPASAYERATLAAIAALQDAGLTVWGWQFIYGRNRYRREERIARAEAEVAARRVQSLRLPGFVVDFENTGDSVFTYHGDAQDAEIYMQTLRRYLPNVKIAASSHRFPSYHPNLPWGTFMAYSDLVMPQVYWVGGDPARNLQASWETYQARWPHLPYVPLGATYGEGGWSASPAEVTAFLEEARRLELPAATFWSWEHARYDEHNPGGWTETQLWDAVAAFPWSGEREREPDRERPPVEASMRRMWVTASLGLLYRDRPTAARDSWLDGVVFAPGTELVAVGRPTARDAQGYRFQKVRPRDPAVAPLHPEGWVTYSIGEQVYLTAEKMLSPPPVGSPEQPVRVTASLGLKFRSQALVDDEFWLGSIVFPAGSVLTAIGEPSAADALGYRWQYVRAPDDVTGWVAHSIHDEVYLEPLPEQTFFPPPPPGSTEELVMVTAELGLRFRSETALDPGYWIADTVFLPGEVLTAIGEPTPEDARHYRWQYVRAPEGRVSGDREGWVAFSIDDACYLRPVAGLPAEYVWSQVSLDLHTSPAGTVVWKVADNQPLLVMENPAIAGSKVGQAGEWLHVRTPSLKEGYVDAGAVRLGSAEDDRNPVAAGHVPTGESAYIFGVHDTYERDLFRDSGKTGWVLLTEQVGANPDTVPGNRNVYYDWTRAGYGVIARLNHGYDGAGTIPESARYDAFANACANWVSRSIDPLDPQHSCHIWVIGNEMNNPREWPGNRNGEGGQPISPENYAALFNRVYTRIKAVQPGAIVCPGAVDPFNAVAGDCRLWFTRMLEHIIALDGLVLHTYTHGSEPALIVNPATFSHPPLEWQYYHFYAYRTFMDLIPGKWREVPVFITETDQVHAWEDTNSGWVREAYAEIDRWNRSPHHQQIRALLLYRWWPVDQWSLLHKPAVVQDFRQAIQQDYRWRASAG